MRLAELRQAYFDELDKHVEAQDRPVQVVDKLPLNAVEAGLIHRIFPGARSKWGNPLEVDDVAIDFPDLRILLAHGGRPFWMGQAFFVLRRHPNVYFEVSGIPPAKLLEYFPRLQQLAHKTVWGTDWPSPGVKDMWNNVEQFLGLGLGEETERAILSENSLALFP